jgi:hypothetical protein
MIQQLACCIAQACAFQAAQAVYNTHIYIIVAKNLYRGSTCRPGLDMTATKQDEQAAANKLLISTTQRNC